MYSNKREFNKGTIYKDWQGSGTHKEYYNISRTGHHAVGLRTGTEGLLRPGEGSSTDRAARQEL